MATTYTIEQAGELSGVTPHTLRYYERIGLLEPVGRAPSGHRRYTDEDLGWVKFLTMLRATGMPIRDMVTFIDITRAGDHTIPQRVDILRFHREVLNDRLKRDREHLEALDRKIGIYEGLLAEAAQPA